MSYFKRVRESAVLRHGLRGLAHPALMAKRLKGGKEKNKKGQEERKKREKN